MERVRRKQKVARWGVWRLMRRKRSGQRQIWSCE